MKASKVNVSLSFFIFLFSLLACAPKPTTIDSTVTTIILVRHAERTGSEDELNGKGQARAQELAKMLKESNVSVIYTSSYNRTKETAMPLSTQSGIKMLGYDANDLSTLTDEIKENHQGEVVLVVGHSNTVPSTVNLLGVKPDLPDIPHDKYSDLYIVTLMDNEYAHLVTLHYGAENNVID